MLAPHTNSMCVHELIANQALLTPHRVALEFQDRRLTYRELDEQSTKFANYLLRLGVKVESLVGVCLDRSIELVVALIGVMKAGSAYLPLDPTFPNERLIYMLQDSGAAILITSERHLWRLSEYTGITVELEQSAPAVAAESSMLRPAGVLPENLAYVIYTSGSTGKPKGVMIPHRAVVNFLRSMRYEPGVTHDDALLAVTTFSFDIAVLELYLPLIVGGRVIVADRDTAMDVKKLAVELSKRHVTVLQATPATWRMLISIGWTGNKRLKAICGGEAMSRDLAEQLLERVGSLWNMYGPTETTVWSLLARIRSGSGAVPVGRPIANTTVYVLDAHNRPAPAGVAGKLYIGGQGLARGYRNRPDLTSEKFIGNPLVECSGERIYDTGDLARYREDGMLEWLGRLDTQVKVRGHRIELEEIESVLRRHPGVRDALVSVQGTEGANKCLVAYVVSSGRDVPSSLEVRQHSEKMLPAYMVPSAFLFLDALPLTSNGKVDRDALPSFTNAGRGSSPHHRVPPESQMEAALLLIFEKLLLVGPVGVTDDFLQLGGNSLLAVQLVMQIEKETGHNIPTATLFDAPTVRLLALKLQDRTYTKDWSRIVELRKGGDSSAEPLFCIHWLDAKLVTFYKIASLLREDRPVYGLQPGDLDQKAAATYTIKDMARVYLSEIRARHPNGPYHLAGSCLGGVVAFEIAQQLVTAGEQVKLLLLIDADMPGPLEYLHQRPFIVEWLDRYFGEFLLSPRAAIKRWLRETTTRLFDQSLGKDALSGVGGQLKKVSREAAASYLPLPFPGKVTLLICSDGPSRAYGDRRLAWSSVADGGFEVHVVPGNHSTMEQDPNIQILGERFQHCFDRLSNESDTSAASEHRVPANGYRPLERPVLESGAS